jgi:hypothetical protein
MAQKRQQSITERLRTARTPTPLPDCVPLVARHLTLETPAVLGHADMAEMAGVDQRTLDNWTRRGCPMAGGARDRRYHPAQVLMWAAAWAMVRGDFQARRIRHMPESLPYLDAWNRVLTRQAELDDAVPFIAVPLEQDHPGRSWALRLACAGEAPGPLLDPEEFLESLPTDADTPTPAGAVIPRRTRVSR